MWEGMLDRVLTRITTEGHLTLRYPSGREARYGPGPDRGLRAEIADPRVVRGILLEPEMAFGEGYMDGHIRIDGDDLEGLMVFVSRNAAALEALPFRRAASRLRRLRRRLDQWNPARRARANVAHHYDLSARLYDLFLDADRQYSCAYFSRPDMTLEEAQEAKKAHIAAKLLIEPGMEILDIGCGWGGLALTLARDHGARVTGVTLSEEQHRHATARAEAEGLAGRVRFELRDYRTVTRRFDRVVSVGMFEHVGAPHYREYFSKVHDLLEPHGVALIHTIGRAGPPGSTSPWIAKYIFPGGYVPAMSEMAAAVEGTGLRACDLEVWRLHYAETLRHWHDRFVAREDEARELYDARFCRMWRFYLKACEHAFRQREQVVYQLQLARAQDAVPLTRDYLYRDDRLGRLSAAE